MRNIPEKDWKVIRKLKDELLERFCEKTINRIKHIIDNQGNSSYKTYLDLWKTMNQEDKKLSSMFDDLKRSTAINKITVWKRNSLISEDEFNLFSSETKELVEKLLSL